MDQFSIEPQNIPNLSTIGFEDKVVICKQSDPVLGIGVVLWIELSLRRSKKRISLNGAAYRKLPKDLGDFGSELPSYAFIKSDMLGFHQINAEGRQTILSSLKPYRQISCIHEAILA
jgi:hypothetical protein